MLGNFSDWDISRRVFGPGSNFPLVSSSTLNVLLWSRAEGLSVDACITAGVGTYWFYWVVVTPHIMFHSMMDYCGGIDSPGSG